MDEVAGSQNDEFYTPQYAIDPLLPYLTKFRSVWCPFDTERSLFVKSLTAAGLQVEHSHLSSGGDFFDLWTDNDVIVSNPPYSLKTEVLGRLFEGDRPFAMLLGVVGLFESQRRFDLFRKNRFEVMYFNRRISYFKSYDDARPALNPPFSSVYVCRDVLPSQIVFAEVCK